MVKHSCNQQKTKSDHEKSLTNITSKVYNTDVPFCKFWPSYNIPPLERSKRLKWKSGRSSAIPHLILLRSRDSQISNFWICYLVAGKTCTVLRLWWPLLMQNNTDKQVCAPAPHILSLLKEKLIVKFLCHITQLGNWICNSNPIYVDTGQLAKRTLRVKTHKMRLLHSFISIVLPWNQ